MKFTLNIIPFLLPTFLLSQSNLSTTYTEGDIPTSYDVYQSTCNGPLTTLSVTLPVGDNFQVTNVHIDYSMTSIDGAWMLDQHSKILFANTNIAESEVSGNGNYEGTFPYSRDISLANGIYPGGTKLTFQMLAKRSLEGVPGCNTSLVYVDNGTWMITVYFGNEIPNPHVGINNTSPEATLDVVGKIKIDDDSDAPVAGMIRWNEESEDFEGFNGYGWVSFSGTSGGWGGPTPVNEIVRLYGYTEYGGFGRSVALSEEYALIGSPYEGLVFISLNNEGVWEVPNILYDPYAEPNSQFGASISISGDYLIIGASHKDESGMDQGKAYIFKKNGQFWDEETTLIASNGTANDYFGKSVSISGDYAIVGASAGGITENGAAYIFKRNGTAWSEQAILTAIEGMPNDQFGKSVSISGDLVIVGAPFFNVTTNSNQGKSFIFNRIGSSWVQQAMLIASDGTTNDQFGASSCISGAYAIVGAPEKTVNGNGSQGAAYIFKQNGITWTQQIKLVSVSDQVDHRFGSSVALSGENAIVGAPYRKIGGNGSQGAAYVFERTGYSWLQQAILTSADGKADDNFGISVAILGKVVAVGAAYANYNSGQVYFY